MRYPKSSKPQAKPIRLEEISGGLNVAYQEHRIMDNQSPYILNLNADDRGALTKRKGQRWVFTELLGGGVNALAYYKGKKVFAQGTKLYSQVDSNEPVEIYSGVANQRGNFFNFNGFLYFINGANFLIYDGTTVKKIEDIAYVPVLEIVRKPDGTTTNQNEDFNLIGNKAKVKFSGDGTSTTFKLPESLKPYDSIDEVKVNEVVVTPTSKDAANGTFVLSAAPSGTTPNNVEVTFTKTITGKADIIKGMRYSVEYEGRIFLSGNENEPNLYHIMGLTDEPIIKANYWPELEYNRLSSSDEAVTGFVTQYDKLVIFKERSIFSCLSGVNLDGTTKFDVSLLNGSIGCDMPHTIQLIDNNPVFANSYGGVYMIRSTQLPGEKNVDCISINIGGTDERLGLLDEANLKEASSLDHHGKYYLCVNDKVYMWDYVLSPYRSDAEKLVWFYYDNIRASCWLVLGDNVFYGHREKGNLVQFISAFNDFGQPIKGVWRSKLYDFGFPEYLKRVSEMWFKTRPNSGKVTIKYYMDKKEKTDTKEIDIKSFNWDAVTWDTWVYDVYRFPPTIKRQPNLTDLSHFQVQFENNELNQNMSILNLVITVSLTRKVR